MAYFQSKNPNANMILCQLCGGPPDDEKLGKLLAFQRHTSLNGLSEDMAVIHEMCAKYTSIVDLGEVSMSGVDFEFRNMFDAVESAEDCTLCRKPGATIGCAESSCGTCYHFICATESGWNFEKRGSKFRCAEHRGSSSRAVGSTPVRADATDAPFQHALFSLGAFGANPDEPGNLSMGDQLRPSGDETDETSLESSAESEVGLKSEGQDLSKLRVESSRSLAETYLVRIRRESVLERWNVDLCARPVEGGNKGVLSVTHTTADPLNTIKDGDIVVSINGDRIGSLELGSLKKVVDRFGQEVDVVLELHPH
jgi:hypothetical protein